MSLGTIDIICGPMFSGKSEELIRRLNKIKISGKEIRVFKPYKDIRTDNFIESRSGFVLPATSLSDERVFLERFTYPDKLVELCVHTVGIDETQFFDKSIVSFVKKLQRVEINIILSGLDTDFAREPFGSMPELLAISNSVTKITAVCHNCGKDAPYTYRKSDSNEQIIVGDSDIYEAACGDCHER